MQSKQLAIVISIVVLVCVGLGIVAKSAMRPKQVQISLDHDEARASDQTQAAKAMDATEPVTVDQDFQNIAELEATAEPETAQLIELEIESEQADPIGLAATNEDEGAQASGQIEANEAAAYSTLRSISKVQAMIQAMKLIDVDGDGLGEYGYLGELAGSAPIRGVGAPREPAFLGKALADVSPTGIVEHDGYLFRMVLPGAQVSGRTPGLAEGNSAQPDADNAERFWSLYAWPAKAGVTGQRAFFINQAGNLTSTTNTDGKYSGESHTPTFDAALSRETPGDMAASVSLASQAGEANDGEEWTTLDW